MRMHRTVFHGKNALSGLLRRLGFGSLNQRVAKEAANSEMASVTSFC